MNKKDILSEDQKDFVLKCARCNKNVSIEYGFEHGFQYATIEINELTHPWSTRITNKHYAYICKSCLDNLIKELHTT